MSPPAAPESKAASRCTIVALEAQYGPIPEFDIFDGAYDITVYNSTPRNSLEVLNQRLRDAEIAIITTMPMTVATLASEITPKLRAIMIMAAGTDHVDLEYCRQRNIRVLNSPQANTETVAEHAIALYFAVRRCLIVTHQGMIQDEWLKPMTLLNSMDRQARPPIGLREEVAGIVGYGGVGKHIATLCKSLGMAVHVADRKLPTNGNQQTEPLAGKPVANSTLARSSFQDILSKCTVIFICVPRNPSTLDMVAATEFSMMSPQALLINVSRGGIVNETDLLDALRSRKIAGAATDVFVAEPAWTKNSVLVEALASQEEANGPAVEKLPLVVSPHTAWYSAVTMDNLKQSVKENVEGWVRGKLPERNIVV